jgi:hypothetical protein
MTACRELIEVNWLEDEPQPEEEPKFWVPMVDGLPVYRLLNKLLTYGPFLGAHSDWVCRCASENEAIGLAKICFDLWKDGETWEARFMTENELRAIRLTASQMSKKMTHL